MKNYIKMLFFQEQLLILLYLKKDGGNIITNMQDWNSSGI